MTEHKRLTRRLLTDSVSFEKNSHPLKTSHLISAVQNRMVSVISDQITHIVVPLHLSNTLKTTPSRKGFELAGGQAYNEKR